MGISNIFEITGTALNVQSIHINTIAKNMANAQTTSNSEESAFRANRPVFSTLFDDNVFSQQSALGASLFSQLPGANVSGVTIDSFSQSPVPIEKQLMPENPNADDDGYVYISNVNMVEEMAFMMEASRNYQANIEVLDTSKQLMLRTLSLGSG